MPAISGILITVRTGRQGAAMEKGKFTPEYKEEIRTLELSPQDLMVLGIAPGQQARLISRNGEAIVACRPKEGPRGLFFLPLGPIANQLTSGETQGTGVPDFKELAVTLKPEPGESFLSDSGEEVCS